MINKMPFVIRIGEKYGSKKGLLKYFYYLVLDKIFNKYKANKVILEQPSRVVFVCKGNICRSSYAEGLFKTKSTLPVCSIGLDTTTGKPANERIINISADMGLPLSSHRTTAIEDFRYSPGDLFICMEPNQLKLIRSFYSKANIVLLGAFSKDSGVYIHDPYSASDSYAKKCLLNISACTIRLVALLNTLPES